MFLLPGIFIFKHKNSYKAEQTHTSFTFAIFVLRKLKIPSFVQCAALFDALKIPPFRLIPTLRRSFKFRCCKDIFN